MFLREIKPGPCLSTFVRLYRIIDFEFPHTAPIPPKAYTPRPEQCIQFFPTPTQFDYPDSGVKNIIPKNAFLIGQHTVINKRTVFQKFLSVQVVFQPGALFHLLGIPLNELTNQLIEAEDIMGSDIERVNDELYHAHSHLQMILIIEQFLSAKFNQIKIHRRPIDHVFEHMLLHPGQGTIDWYANHACICQRQFDRKFKAYVGISPKAYYRIIRFDQAYRMKNYAPHQSWFNIAISCGYQDYQHLSKDYQDFTGYTPVAFFAMDAPERLLGSEEVY